MGPVNGSSVSGLFVLLLGTNEQKRPRASQARRPGCIRADLSLRTDTRSQKWNKSLGTTAERTRQKVLLRCVSARTMAKVLELNMIARITRCFQAIPARIFLRLALLILGMPATPDMAQSVSSSERMPQVVFVVGENEYHTWETLPDFARKELEPRGLSCLFVMASPKEHDNVFTNFAIIKQADLLFLSARRRTPPKEMMALIRAHLKAGKPLIGIRTASHAFGADPPDEVHQGWRTFDRDILGCSYQDHYNNSGPNAPATLVKVLKEALPHPVLSGIPTEELRVTSHLYKNRELAATVTPLMSGHVEGRTESEPVAWVNTDEDRRVFYTSLGSPDDFKEAFFRRLLVNAVLWSLGRPVPNDISSGLTPVP